MHHPNAQIFCFWIYIFIGMSVTSSISYCNLSEKAFLNHVFFQSYTLLFFTKIFRHGIFERPLPCNSNTSCEWRGSWTAVVSGPLITAPFINSLNTPFINSLNTPFINWQLQPSSKIDLKVLYKYFFKFP